jgi:MFS family permease
MFPTGNRGRAAGLITAAALIGGSFGLLASGQLLDNGWSYGKTMALMAVGEVIAVAIILARYPETAHKDLDELNPEPPLDVSAEATAASLPPRRRLPDHTP